MSTSNKKTAVVVIHGIGNQYPMETTREFVESLKDDTDILYSSPDREANFYETRRLSLGKKKTDFYEFYWANLISEPSFSDLFNWIRKLMFFKAPSQRAKLLLQILRIVIVLVVFLLIYAIHTDLTTSLTEKLIPASYAGITTVVIFLLVKVVMPMLNSKASQTIGDAVKYLNPSPKNIESRFKIREKGISLLKKLHDKKDENGDPLYGRIVIVGHSLGSIVGYDVINYLWHDYLAEYAPNQLPIVQPILKKITKIIVQQHKEQEKGNKEYQFPLEEYQQLQAQLFEELKSLGNPWLISDFVTIGSPLCHGDYIMSKDYDEFDRRTNYREISLNPPKIEVKLSEGKIVKDYTKAIAYPATIPVTVNQNRTKENIKLINHSSHFAFIKWNNLYFTNDLVGGNLGYYFGNGIKNTELKPVGKWYRKYLPFFSHTNYWDKEQTASVDWIKKIVFPDE